MNPIFQNSYADGNAYIRDNPNCVCFPGAGGRKKAAQFGETLLLYDS